MLTAAAVTGILSVPGGYAFADADVDSLLADSQSMLADSLPTAVHGPVGVCDDGVVLGDRSASGDDCITVGDILGGSGSGRSYGEEGDEEEDCDEPGDEPARPESPDSPRPESPRPAPERPAAHQARTLPAPAPQLAETGGGDPTTLAAGGLGAVLLAGGGILYRRGRAAAGR